MQPLWKTVWRLLKKLKIELPYDPSIALLGIYPEDMKIDLKGYTYPCVYSISINNSQTMGRAQMSINDECIKRMWYTYTMEYYSTIKKNEVLLFVMTWMELECIMLSEINQS